jgi:hypothetical protein
MRSGLFLRQVACGNPSPPLRAKWERTLRQDPGIYAIVTCICVPCTQCFETCRQGRVQNPHAIGGHAFAPPSFLGVRHVTVADDPILSFQGGGGWGGGGLRMPSEAVGVLAVAKFLAASRYAASLMELRRCGPLYGCSC